MTIRPPSALRTSRSLPAKPRMRSPVCWARPRSSFMAASASSGLARRTCTALLEMPTPGDGDLGIAQALACVVAQCVEPVLAHLRRLHGEQQMRAAAQVEAQIDLRPGHEPRPARHRLFGEEARQRTKATPTTTLRTMAICFQRVKCSIEASRSGQQSALWRHQQPAKRSRALFDRLALGPHLGRRWP